MRKRIFSLLGVALLCVLGYAFLNVNLSIQSRRAMPSALAMLESDAEVRITESEWIVLEPTAGQPDTGLILYPGGFVDVRAYAPIARLLAERGFLVVLVEPALATALLSVDEAGRIAAAYPQIAHWAVGGHSLGGVAAARAAHRDPGRFDGVILMAAAPASGDDLSDSGVALLGIFGTEDMVYPVSRLEEFRDLLPADSAIVEIEGGNHAQFGRYGDGTQSGDGVPLISVEAQEEQIAELTAGFLNSLGED